MFGVPDVLIRDVPAEVGYSARDATDLEGRAARSAGQLDADRVPHADHRGSRRERADAAGRPRTRPRPVSTGPDHRSDRRGRRLIVLHDDKDFELIADTAPERLSWRRGSPSTALARSASVEERNLRVARRLGRSRGGCRKPVSRRCCDQSRLRAWVIGRRCWSGEGRGCRSFARLRGSWCRCRLCR